MQKYQHIFDTNHLTTGLKKRSLQSGTIAMLSQAITFVLQIGSTIILARILAPEDYGINAMAVAVTGFVNIFANLGLSTATIQRPDINHDQVSALFWINVVIGFVLCLLVAAISPAVAIIYNEPAVTKVMLVLSFSFVIGGFSVQHSALLSRQMRFYDIAKINIISLLISILVAIVAAHYGLGYWSLVLHTLTHVACVMIGYWMACKWVPGRPKRGADIASMVKFGSDIVAFNVVAYFANNLDRILVGRYIGAGPLGLYSKAYQILMMPISNLRDPLARVTMPALSRLQSEPEQFRNYYLKCVAMLAFVSMPLVVFLFVCADQLVYLLLGSQWLGAATLFQILAFAAFIQPVSSTAGMVLLSTGKSRRYLVLGVAYAVMTCICFIVGINWGVKGVAAGYSFSHYLIFFPNLFLSFMETKIKILDFILAISKPAVSSIAGGLFCYFLIAMLIDNHVFVLLLLSFVSSASVYIIAYCLMPGGIRDVKEYLSYVKLILNKD